MRLFRFILLVCCSVTLTPFASADTYSFSAVLASGTVVSANLTTTPDASTAGALDITGISGQVGTDQIVALVPSSYNPNGDGFALQNQPGWWITYDNLLYPGVVFDDNGLLFQLSSGTDLNLYFDPNAGFQAYDTNNNITQNMYDVSVAAETPEPSSLILLGTAILVSGFVLNVSRKRLRPRSDTV